MQDTLQGRLDYLGLDQQARAGLERLRPAVEAHLPAALDRLQSRVGMIPTPVRFLFGREQIESGPARQAAQFRAVLTGNVNEETAEASTRLGQRHARLRIDPRWHLGGYAVMLETVIRGVIHDEIAEAVRPRKGKLGLSIPRDPAAILADADAVAEGLAGVVKSVLLDIDLMVSAHIGKLAEDARATEEQMRGRMRKAAQATGETLRLVAEGRLDERISVLDPEFEPVRDSANAVAERLGQVLRQLRSSSHSLRMATSEIRSSAGDLADQTLQQAVTIEQANAMIRHLASTLADNAKRLSAAGKLAKGLTHGASASGDAVRAAGDALAVVQKDAASFAELVTLFDDMALKSNVLAVRAAAEAAQAGKAGAGVSEVAAHLRELAKEAAETSIAARKLLDAQAGQVDAASSAVARANGVLETISGNAAESAQAVDAVAKAGRSQCDALEQVTLVLRQMDDAIQGHAVLGEQTAAALQETTMQIEALDMVLGLFRTQEEAALQAAS
jgi:methyl-accepting chemotaxis protein